MSDWQRGWLPATEFVRACQVALSCAYYVCLVYSCFDWLADMTPDFGNLVDFLRGELDSPGAEAVRRRLESDAEYFALFQRLRRTYAVLRSLPRIGHATAAANPAAAIPLTQPTPEFIADVRREFEARHWHGLLPLLLPAPAFVSALRAEFSVRGLLASIPMLLPPAQWMALLRAEYGMRAATASLPLIRARAAWVGELRREFSIRALVASIPEIAVRPEFAAALRAEFKQRALHASVPQLSVRDGFRRKLAVALFETGSPIAADHAPVAGASPVTALPVTALPVVEARDSFRRRLFRKLSMAGRRSPRAEPRRVNVAEYHWGREISRGVRSSRKSLAITSALHVIAITIMLFVFVRPDSLSGEPRIAQMTGESVAMPQLPGEVGDPPRFTADSGLNLSGANPDWSSINEVDAIGLDSSDLLPPSREVTEPEAEQPVPIPDTLHGSPLAQPDVLRDNVAGFFRLRGSSREQKVAYLGSEELYAALDRALLWLQRNQQAEGNWGHVGVADMRTIPQDPDLLEVAQLELTSVALLAFLGDGHSSTTSPMQYDVSVRRGLAWLLKSQRANGQFGPEAKGSVLVHAMATLALAEEFGLTRDARLREPLRAACRWLCAVQSVGPDGKANGGFPFLIGQRASLMTSVWAYMALATARHVRVPPIDLPQQRLDAFLTWYDRETRGALLTDEAALLVQSDLLPSAAAGALSLFAVDAGFDNLGPNFAQRVGRELPTLDPKASRRSDNSDVRYHFFGSLTCALNAQRGGAKAAEWQSTFAATVLKHQNQQGWFEATSDYGSLYGRVLGTAMTALAIENAYRVSILSK